MKFELCLNRSANLSMAELIKIGKGYLDSKEGNLTIASH